MADPEAYELLLLAEEQLHVAKREVERGRVVVRTKVETREERAEATLRHEDVEVERVRVDRMVDAAPPIREEGDVLIVPVLEERLVVTKQLVVTEELRIRRRTRVEEVREPVQLRSERAEVVRVGGDPERVREPPPRT